MGNLDAGEEKKDGPNGPPAVEGETAPGEGTSRPEIDEIRRLLGLANASEPGSDARVAAIGQIFELLLTPEYAPLLESPRFLETSIMKAYEFAEVPALAWVTQQFLLKHHPEAFGFGEEGGG